MYVCIKNPNATIWEIIVICILFTQSKNSCVPIILTTTKTFYLLSRANAQQPKLFVGMILILIFAEALALYGLIVGIILSSRAGQSRAD